MSTPAFTADDFAVLLKREHFWIQTLFRMWEIADWDRRHGFSCMGEELALGIMLKDRLNWLRN